MYAGGRPLWHLSLCHQEDRTPVPVLRWSPTTVRKVEAARDRILNMCGTKEPVIAVNNDEIAAETGMIPRTMQWRKPLSIEEINRMAPTAEVRERKGRP